MALLRSHPQVHIEGEIFKRLNGRSCKEIWEELYGNRPKKVKQVGFKLFYYHPADDDQQVWDFLLNDKEIGIIHLRRENMLRALVSQKIGEKTKRWTQHITDNTELEKTIKLDTDECLETFERISSYEERTRNQFKDHKTFVECTYEELSDNTYELIAEVYDSLGLSKHHPTTVLKKQNPEHMRDLVENYDEIKQKFGTGKWSYLIE